MSDPAGTFTTQPERCFFNAPFAALADGLIDDFIRLGLQPEIGLEGDVLYRYRQAEFAEIAAVLHAHGLGCTLHAPFFDLAPGALDKEILRVTRAKLAAAFDLVEIFAPRRVVCHLGFEDNKHGYKEEPWRAASLETWRRFAAAARGQGSLLVLENTYERTPAHHRLILETLAADGLEAGLCLDCGHLNAFAAVSWQDWLPAMNPWLRHLHLHDNDGRRDRHLAIGRGTFDFPGLFAFLHRHALSPTLTFEPHGEDELMGTLDALERRGIVHFPTTRNRKTTP